MGKLKDFLISEVENATAKLCEQHNIKQSFPGDQQSAEIHDMHIEGELKTAISGYINHNFSGTNKSEVFQVIKLVSEVSFENRSQEILKLHNDQNNLLEDS